jgi:glycosyltransferase involved in cell wall biosynthesis
MKIAIICDYIDEEKKTWVWNFQYSFIKRLVKRKNEWLDKDSEYIFIHKTDNELTKNFKNILINSGYNWILWIFEYWFKRLVLLNFKLKKEKIDILHNLNYAWPIYFDFFWSYKKVSTLYDFIPIIFPEHCTKMEVIFSKVWLNFVLKKSDLVLAISENTKKDWIKLWIKKEKIETLYIWAENKNVDKKFENKYWKYILWVSSISPHKNIKLLIYWYNKLIIDKKFSDIKLVFVWNKRFDIPLVTDNDNIIFTWFLKDEELVSLYKNALIFVCPSIYEWFWLPVLEAMQYWIPVISSNSSSLPEVVWSAWILIDVDDSDWLSLWIKKIISDEKLKEDLIKKWFENIKKFDLDKMTLNTLHIYKKLSEWK